MGNSATGIMGLCIGAFGYVRSTHRLCGLRPVVVLRADDCCGLRIEAEEPAGHPPLSNHWLSSHSITLHHGSGVVNCQHFANKSEECRCGVVIDCTLPAALFLL